MGNKSLRVIFVGLLSMGLVACGQGMNTKSVGSLEKATDTGGSNLNNNDGALEPVPFDVQKVTEEVEVDTQAAIQEADAAAKEAERYLNRIKLGGGKITVGDSGGSRKQLIIDKVIKRVLDKIAKKLEKAPEKFDQLRGKLADKIAKLDDTNPLHQSAIAGLMKAMERIDDLESRYNQLLARVAKGMDIVIDRLGGLVSAVPFPVSVLAAIEWADVKRVLRDFQSQLRNR